MQFTDSAIVLSARKHAEHSGLAQVLTREHGLCSGMVRSLSGKAARGVWEPGNALLVTWRARLAEQLGSFRAELITPFAALYMQEAARLSALTSATALTEQSLPEREPHPELYDALQHLMNTLAEPGWRETYARFELTLLSACGFRLDLAACAATGVVEDLVYVSPVTGRAVSANAGEPYRDRLLHLPAHLRPGANHPPDAEELLASLRLTGYFLDAWVLTPHERRMPAARARLMEHFYVDA